MKQLLCVFCFLGISLTTSAQTRFGNEWLRPEQTYLKISIEKTGIYRLEYESVKAHIPTLLGANPAMWQLFYRGTEQAIRVVGGQDGRFDAGDFLEFYGEANDGATDSLLYRPQQRLHPYQSLFSDRAAYFLSARPGAVGKRMATPTLPTTGLVPELFHLEEAVQAFTTEYSFNNLKGIEPFLQQSFYEPGEGWTGKLFPVDTVRTVAFNLTGLVPAGGPVLLSGLLNGRDNNGHRVQVLPDGAPPLPTLAFSGFASQPFQATLAAGTLPGQFRVRFIPERTGFSNNVSVTFVKLTFPQQTDMASLAFKVFRVPPGPRQTALLNLTNVPPNTLAYDLTDKANIRFLSLRITDSQGVVSVDRAENGRTLLLTNQFSQPAALRAVRFSAMPPASANYLIVTHSSLRTSATAYANYRASAAGGGYKPFIIEADSLYDIFSFGEKTPLALRRFADYTLTNTAATYLLLMGQANSYPYTTKTAANDLVPTVGYPGSDILITAGLANTGPNTPALATGRLNVTTNEQVLTYLEKVRQQEGTTPNGLWRKRVLHISGGKTAPEAANLRGALGNLGTILKTGTLGGEVAIFSKNSTEEVEKINIAPQVNDGVGLITFFGHAGPSITDMNFGFASLPENGFQNQQYPFMIFNGCGVGEIFSRFNTLSTDWLLAPRKGAALVLAHSYLSYEQPTTTYLNQLYTDLFATPTTLGMPFGRVQQRLNKTLDRDGISPYDVSVMNEMVLQGDPALVLYPLPAPDYAVEKPGIYLQAKIKGSSLASTDSVRVVVPLVNLGKFTAAERVPVVLKQTIGTTVTITPLTINPFRLRDTLTYLMARNEKLTQLEVVIDPNTVLTELSRTNNTATLPLNWSLAQGSSFPPNLLPDRASPSVSVLLDGVLRENGAMVGLRPQLTVFILDENPLSPTDTTAADVFLAECATCAGQRLRPGMFTLSAGGANQLRFTTALTLKPATTYQLLVFGRDAAGNRTPSPYALTLQTALGTEAVGVRVYPNPATSFAKLELLLPKQVLPSQNRLTIYAPTGHVVSDEAMEVRVGVNEVIWQGTVPGVYPYVWQLTYPDGHQDTYRGKVVWQP